MKKMYIIVDVGCIECGEQTEIRGFFSTKKNAEKAFNKLVKELEIKDWEPRGGFLELLGLHNKGKTTYLGGCSYFTGGQHALEIHVYPSRNIKK